MIPAAFDYEAPATVEEALGILSSAGDREVKLLAGGQSLLPVLRLRMAAPELVVDLGRIPELRGVRDDGDAVVIGAMTTHDDVTREPLVRQHALLLAEAARTVADPQVRHRGTFGGSLAHADPAGDMPAPALALDAEMVLAGPSGRRTVPAEEFFQDLLTTALNENELLAEIRVPKHTGWGAHYEKFNRVAQAWSIVAVAAAVRVEAGVIAQAKVALTNMGVVPIRAHRVEQALVGREANAEAIRDAAGLAADGTSPMSDGNADEDYRRHLATVLTGRAVLAAAGV
ncbi:MAG TPA: xanthine dehydrogenase family protein subunit M [Kineosporiaceae bacterium]|nr:xanthine dehydrogenase family protein subunit M [Kineosporiaceae bacterium]